MPLAVKLIPALLMAEFRAAAATREGKPVSRAGLLAIVVLWIAGAALVGWWFYQRVVR
jgi:hypothetical protein